MEFSFHLLSHTGDPEGRNVALGTGHTELPYRYPLRGGVFPRLRAAQPRSAQAQPPPSSGQVVASAGCYSDWQGLGREQKRPSCHPPARPPSPGLASHPGPCSVRGSPTKGALNLQICLLSFLCDFQLLFLTNTFLKTVKRTKFFWELAHK